MSNQWEPVPGSDKVILRYTLIGTTIVGHIIYCPVQPGEDYSTFTYQDGRKLGELTSLRPDSALLAEPAGTPGRVEAVRGHYARLKAQAARILREVFPADFQ